MKKTGGAVNLIVDTSVWSLFLRREKLDYNNQLVQLLRNHLLNNDCIHLIGSILQELLDGVKSQKQFNTLVEYFEPFPLIELDRHDYIYAAELRNVCRAGGIKACIIDFQIASACINRKIPLLTADKDFKYIADFCELSLLRI
jgi:predicted nucleic acid-binding protein